MFLCCTSSSQVISFKLLHTPFNRFCEKGGIFLILIFFYIFAVQNYPGLQFRLLSLVCLYYFWYIFSVLHLNLCTLFYCACNQLNLFPVSVSSFYLKWTCSMAIHYYWTKEHTGSRRVHWGGTWGYCIEPWVMYLSFQTLEITNFRKLGETWLGLINSCLCMLHQSQSG